MELYLIKDINGHFLPAYNSDFEMAKKIHPGETLKAVITRPRNLLFHKKFFALLNLAFENQEQYSDFESFRAVVTMKAGYYTPVATEKGMVFLPKSISFAAMDDLEFEEVYNKVFDVILKIVPTITEQEIADFM